MHRSTPTLPVSEPTHEFMKPLEVAKLLRVSHQSILGFIHRGELSAINLGRTSRPIFRISRDALDQFLAARTKIRSPAQQSSGPRRPPEGGPLDPALGAALVKKGQAVQRGDNYYRLWEGKELRY